MIRRTISALAVPALVCLPLALGACGGGNDNASQEQIAQARKDAAAQQKIKDKQAQLEKELAALKKERRNSPSSGSATSSGGSSTSSATGGAVPATASSCGGGVSAGPNTTCAFAVNTATAYFRANGGSPTVSVYSPVTQRTYTMTCTAGAPTVCRGGDNATVFIR